MGTLKPGRSPTILVAQACKNGQSPPPLRSCTVPEKMSASRMTRLTDEPEFSSAGPATHRQAAAHRNYAAVVERLPENGNVAAAFERFPVRLSDQDDENDSADTGLATVTSKPKLKRPPMYKVILLNDDYTPMEFVVHVLEIFFGIEREKATQIMLAVHTQGSAVVGIFPRDIAETKSEQVNQYSQENNHPLISTVEMTD